jgi:hypothetical protein
MVKTKANLITKFETTTEMSTIGSNSSII